MKSNLKILLFLIIFSLCFSIVFAGESHCWRQNILRQISVDYTFDPPVLVDYPIKIVSKDSILTLSGFGNYDYRCDNGASGNAINYVEVYDKKTGRVIKNNGVNSGGPESIGAVMCYDNEKNIACYMENEKYVPAKGTCDLHKGGRYVGRGSTPTINISLAEFQGEQEWGVRFGVITPYFSGIKPGSEEITFRDVRDLNFIIDASKPAILVFPPTPLQKINTFTLEEDINKEVYFTLLNKSKVPIKINDYFVNCPAGFNCSLEEKLDGSGGKFYAGYTILPNQAMIISAIYSIKEDMVPVIASSTMEVKFTPENFKNCPLEGCVAKSSPLNFQVGLIDQQEFQINVSNQQEQKYCVDYEGRVGRTGKSYLPKINLYLGGNSPVSSLQSESNLISMDECSPVDLNGRENSNWVYCTQKEFLVQLAKRIDKYYTNLEAIESLESLARFDDARKRREENGLLSSFSVYLRAQDLDLDNRSNSISRLAQIENETILTNIGFKGEKITDINKLGSLISGITIKKLVKGVQVGSLEITPGEYKVVIDINRDEDNMGLFVEGRLNNQVKIVVSLEKKSEPKLNWFFYYQDNDLDNVDYATPTIESLYKNNYSERGMILSFEKKEGEVGNLEKFYSTYAVPLIVRLVGQNKEGDYISDSEFILKKVNHSYKKGDIFSIWSGFASSEGQGCTSTVKSEQGKGLPYRVLDTAIDELGRFEIKDLNHLKQGSVMYLSTVLYLPSSEEIQLEAPFNIYTSKEKIVGTPEAVGAITIKENTYGEHKISSIKELFSAFEEGKVCVLYDNSTGREKWELFWNQDKILDQLEDIKKSIKDAKRCESSELKAS